MQIYLVGGAVRDALLGKPLQDRDWVVVGATAQALLAQGFVPVGRDFPVFLHPLTHEEYALARTERKTAPGYHGFIFHAASDVTLEQDLSRRDLTINAMAVRATCSVVNGVVTASVAADAASWQQRGDLVDPFGGQADLARKVLRHLTQAFREDPVRILRVARFAARFADFTLAAETLQLMREMAASGEISHLVPERVWQELANGLMQVGPSRMFELLHSCNALPTLLPALAANWDGNCLLAALDQAAHRQAPLPVRAACLLQKELESDPHCLALLRLPTDCRELAQLLLRESGNINASIALGSQQTLTLLERCDALRQPGRFEQLLLASECLACATDGENLVAYPPRQRLLAALAAAQSVATASIAASALAAGRSGPAVGEQIRRARQAAIAAVLSIS